MGNKADKAGKENKREGGEQEQTGKEKKEKETPIKDEKRKGEEDTHGQVPLPKDLKPEDPSKPVHLLVDSGYVQARGEGEDGSESMCRVGKSSLVRFLRELPFEPDLPATKVDVMIEEQKPNTEKWVDYKGDHYRVKME